MQREFRCNYRSVGFKLLSATVLMKNARTHRGLGGIRGIRAGTEACISKIGDGLFKPGCCARASAASEGRDGFGLPATRSNQRTYPPISLRLDGARWPPQGIQGNMLATRVQKIKTHDHEMGTTTHAEPAELILGHLPGTLLKQSWERQGQRKESGCGFQSGVPRKGKSAQNEMCKRCAASTEEAGQGAYPRTKGEFVTEVRQGDGRLGVN